MTENKFLGDIMDLQDDYHLNAYIHFVQRGFLPTDYIKWLDSQNISRIKKGITWNRYIEIKLWAERVDQIYFNKTGNHLKEINIDIFGVTLK